MGGALYYFQDRSAIFLSVTEIAEIRDRENAERRLARARATALHTHGSRLGR